jgi:murein DD-endopeptidase MepM/ murein hydrolase activator NlpD
VRRARALLVPLTIAAVAVPSAPARASDGDGGASAPVAGGSPPIARPGPNPERHAQPKGGASPRNPRHRRLARRRSAPVLTSFALYRPRLFLYGRAARVSFRLRGRSLVRVRLELLATQGGRPLRTIALGERAPGVTHSVLLTGREEGTLSQGDYVVHIAGRDRRGRRLRRAPRASSTARLSFYHHRFPLVGAFDYGGEDARFGAERKGHRHQGQDLMAAEGTPVVAPRGGTIEFVQYQARGAGHYVVLDGEAEDRDYVLMHLRAGSVVVDEGQRVRTGERIGKVGSTGSASAPHLHFEVWTGGWQEPGGRPIDPLPLLRAWDGFS